MRKIPIHYQAGRCPECDKAGYRTVHTDCRNTSLCLSPDESETDYYDRPANVLSNSELGRIKAEMMGKKPGEFSEQAKIFGRWFHKALLEPAKWKAETAGQATPELVKIAKMVRNARRSQWLCHLLDSAVTEIEHEYFFDLFGAPFKAKIDARMSYILADPKSTSCTNYKDFLQSCFDYDYIRQGTIYLHGTGASQFYLVGISKTVEAPPFIVPVHDYPSKMAEAWEETEKIINFHKMTQHVEQ